MWYPLLVALVINAFAEPMLRRHNSRPLDAEGDLAAFVPWETPVSGFFVRSHHEIPVVDLAHWRLVIDGQEIVDIRAYLNQPSN